MDEATSSNILVQKYYVHVHNILQHYRGKGLLIIERLDLYEEQWWEHDNHHSWSINCHALTSKSIAIWGSGFVIHFVSLEGGETLSLLAKFSYIQ